MSTFSEEVLKQEPILWKNVTKSPHYFVGEDAVRRVEELEGPLTPAQRRVIMLEGFVDAPYLDEKGVKTIGAGMTGKFMKGTFKDSYEEHVNRVKKKIKKFDTLPPVLQTELIQSAYRGGIIGSPQTIRLINQGKFGDAAVEFLDNKEYRAKRTSPGVKKRMLALSNALAAADEESVEFVPMAIPASAPAQTAQQTANTFTSELLGTSAPVQENVAPAAPQTPSRARENEANLQAAFNTAEEQLIQARMAELDAEEEQKAFSEEEERLIQERMAQLEAEEANLGVVHQGEAGIAEQEATMVAQEAEDERLDNLF